MSRAFPPLPPPAKSRYVLQKHVSIVSTQSPQSGGQMSIPLRESGLSAIPDSLQTDIYTHHSCSLCKDETTPANKSSLHHSKLNKYTNLAKDIEPPHPLPTEWSYKPPPIFIPVTHNLDTAVTLQKVLEY